MNSFTNSQEIDIKNLYFLHFLEENKFIILLLNDKSENFLKEFLEHTEINCELSKLEIDNYHVDKHTFHDCDDFHYSFNRNRIGFNNLPELSEKTNIPSETYNTIISNIAKQVVKEYISSDDSVNTIIEFAQAYFEKSLEKEKIINELNNIVYDCNKNLRCAINYTTRNETEFNNCSLGFVGNANSFNPRAGDEFYKKSLNSLDKIQENDDYLYENNDVFSNFIEKYKEYNINPVIKEKYLILYFVKYNMSVVIKEDENTSLYKNFDPSYFSASSNLTIETVETLTIKPSHKTMMLSLFDKVYYPDKEAIKKRIKLFNSEIQNSDEISDAFNIEDIRTLLDRFYVFTNSKEHRIKSSQLLDFIVKSLEIPNTLGIRNSISKELGSIGLKKYRLSDGYYYYGLKEQMTSDGHNYITPDVTNIKNIISSRNKERDLFRPKPMQDELPFGSLL